MAFIWFREPQITSLIEMEHFWSHLQSCTNIILAFCSSKINFLSVTAMCFLGPVSTVFPECQHPFSIVLNKQNAYLASCDHLERKRCTQRAFPGQNIQTFQNGAGDITVALFQAVCHSSPVTLVTKKMEDRLVLFMSAYPELHQL